MNMICLSIYFDATSMDTNTLPAHSALSAANTRTNTSGPVAKTTGGGGGGGYHSIASAGLHR